MSKPTATEKKVADELQRIIGELDEAAGRFERPLSALDAGAWERIRLAVKQLQFARAELLSEE